MYHQSIDVCLIVYRATDDTNDCNTREENKIQAMILERENMTTSTAQIESTGNCEM